MKTRGSFEVASGVRHDPYKSCIVSPIEHAYKVFVADFEFFDLCGQCCIGHLLYSKGLGKVDYWPEFISGSKILKIFLGLEYLFDTRFQLFQRG